VVVQLVPAALAVDQGDGQSKPSSSRSRIIERGLDRPEPPAMKSTGTADFFTKKRP
jgi:hypothetical protein